MLRMTAAPDAADEAAGGCGAAVGRFVVVVAAVIAGSRVRPRADELHIGRLDVERVAVVVVAVGPFLDAKAALDIDGTALCEIFCGGLGMLAPERDLEPSRDVLQLAGFVAAFLVRRHRKAAYGDALRRVTEFGILAEIADDE